MELAWLVWALATVGAWGIGTLASKPATDGLGPRVLFLGTAGTEGIAFAAMGLLLVRPAFLATPATVGIALAAGATGMLGYLMFYEGMRWGSVGLVGTVTAAYPAVTVVLSVVLLHEALSAAQGVGVVLMLLCVLLLAAERTGMVGRKRIAILLSVVGFLAWGVWGVLAKVSVEAMGEANLFLFYAAADAFVFGGYFALRRFPRPPTGPRDRTVRLAVIAVLAGVIGVFATTIAYANGPASLVTSVTGSYPVVSTLGAAVWLRERFTARIALALVCFGSGLALISIV